MLRPATRDDKAQIVLLLKQISEQHAVIAPDRYQVASDAVNLAFVERYLTDEKSTVLVVEENRVVIGVAFCIIHENNPEGPVKDALTAVLDTIVIDASYRGKGYGRQLLRAAETWAKKNGCSRIKLNVAVENTQGIDFYHRCGYTQSDIRFSKKI